MNPATAATSAAAGWRWRHVLLAPHRFATVPASPGAACLLGIWGVRHGDWYGCLRADGRSG